MCRQSDRTVPVNTKIADNNLETLYSYWKCHEPLLRGHTYAIITRYFNIINTNNNNNE